MQSDQQQYFPQKPGLPLADQVGSGYLHDVPTSSFSGGPNLSPCVRELPPFHNVDFQPSKICPRNFIIFDRTDDRSQIMYHPAIAPNFCYPGQNASVPYFEENLKRDDANNKREMSPTLKEDSADIDALLSFEDEEDGDYDEEEVSTARTDGNYESDSADSCSSKPRKSRLPSSSQKSTSSGNSRSDRKRQKMRKMVKALRGIVPGGKQMNTVAVLDEAVRYLKSLKVEVKKFGVGNLKN